MQSQIKFLIICLVLSLVASNYYAQNLNAPNKKRTLTISAGGTLSSFQAVNISNVRYNGLGFAMQIAYQRTTEKKYNRLRC